MKTLQSFRDTVEEKRKPPKSKEVNLNRIVLFNFLAAKEYPEQISVKSHDVVFVYEDFPDGWSEVKTCNTGRLGVVPTAYLGELPPANAQQHTTAAETTTTPETPIPVPTTIPLRQKASVIAKMAQDKAIQKMVDFVHLTVNTGLYLGLDVVLPFAQRVHRIATKSESTATTLSVAVRNVSETIFLFLIPRLSEHELSEFSSRLQVEAARIKAERVNRSLSASENKPLERKKTMLTVPTAATE